MKKFIAIIILLTNLSCNSQNKQEVDIRGNWRTDIKEIEPDDNYVEVLIDSNSFEFYYEFSGYAGHIDYKIENNIFYYDFSDELEKKGTIKIIDKNNFSIGNDGMVFKRITEGLTLEDFLRKNTPESDYRKFFDERMSAWKKSNN